MSPSTLKICGQDGSVSDFNSLSLNKIKLSCGFQQSYIRPAKCQKAELL